MTKQELDSKIIQLHREGLNGRQIAKKLYISESKATSTIQQYREKLRIVGEMAVELYFTGMDAKEAVKRAREVIEHEYPRAN